MQRLEHLHSELESLKEQLLPIPYDYIKKDLDSINDCIAAIRSLMGIMQACEIMNDPDKEAKDIGYGPIREVKKKKQVFDEMYKILQNLKI